MYKPFKDTECADCRLDECMNDRLVVFSVCNKCSTYKYLIAGLLHLVSIYYAYQSTIKMI